MTSHFSQSLKANEDLRKELQAIRDQLAKRPSPTHGDSKVTPSPRHPAPSPSSSTPPKESNPRKVEKTKKDPKTSKRASPADDDDGSEDEPQPTLEARLHRLRRVCERKPSGRCHVPESVHLNWVQGDLSTRKQMLETLEAASWDKDWCVV